LTLRALSFGSIHSFSGYAGVKLEKKKLIIFKNSKQTNMKNDELLSETTTPLIFSFDGLENLPKSKWPKVDVDEGRSGENGNG
jgi:hypothetical protein